MCGRSEEEAPPGVALNPVVQGHQPLLARIGQRCAYRSGVPIVLRDVLILPTAKCGSSTRTQGTIRESAAFGVWRQWPGVRDATAPVPPQVPTCGSLCGTTEDQPCLYFNLKIRIPSTGSRRDGSCPDTSQHPRVLVQLGGRTLAFIRFTKLSPSPLHPASSRESFVSAARNRCRQLRNVLRKPDGTYAVVSNSSLYPDLKSISSYGTSGVRAHNLAPM